MPDLAPVVSIVEPRASLEVTPSASVPIIFQITDDFGIGDAALHWTSGEGGQSAVLLDEEIRRRGEGPARYDGSHSWELAPLKLRVGGMVRYHISAVDNRRSPGIGEPQQSDSQPRELKIIAETELLSQLREDLLVVESQLRQVILHQEAIEDRTTEIVEAAAAGLTAQLPTIDSLAGRESRLIEKTQDMVGRLEAVDRRMAMNGGPEADLERLVDESVASLRDTAAAEMAEVVRSLESISALPEQDQVAALRGAQQAERQAVEQLRAVGRKLSQWGSFQGLVSRTRELLDRQTELRDETSATGRSLMGKPLSALTEEELNELKELERRQLQVVADLEQHLAQMREHQSGIAQRDPAGAEAIGAALRAERANPTTDRAKSAAKAIGENRTAAAGIDQRAAVESMRKLVAALQERQTRELEELRKQVAEAEDQVAWLIEHQKALLSATSEAGLVAADQETFASLAEQQGTLAQNTTFTADDLGESERTAAIAGMVEDAAEPMQKARGHLSEASADAASAAQQDAIELLEEALRELQNLAQAASEEWLRHSLNRIHDHLEAMLDGQRAVDHGIGELRTALQANPKLGRAQTRQATQLAREQADVRSLLSGVQEDLQTVPVYAWALDRVSKWMDLSSGKLISREIDEELAQASGRIVRELEKLVQALVDTQSMPMQEEFMEAESSAGGSSAGQASAVSVPTVAELIVLKAMQQDIAVRTAEFQRSFDAADTSEEQLRVLSHLGEDQAELRRLTELVTEKARKP
jgi:hypothetical protein